MAGRPTTLEDCFRQGTQAREDRRGLADNPYNIDTDEHREWSAGWNATLDLDEDDDPGSMRIDASKTDDGELADGSED